MNPLVDQLANPLANPLPNPLANMLINMLHKGNGFDNRYIYMFVNGLVTLERALEASRREAPGPGLAGGSAATQPRLRLFAKCAFEQRFLSKFTRKAWERQALRGGAAPSGGTAHAGRDGRLPFTPCAVSASALAESATNPKMPLALLTAPALDAPSSWGWSRLPREASTAQGSSREVSLGLNLSSVLPWGSPVEPRIATRTFLGMWHLARSRCLCRSTGTAPATSPLGRPSLPVPTLGDRTCVREI